MKTNLKLTVILACLLLGSAIQTFAQEDAPWIIEITTVHWNMDKEDFSFKKWKEMESEFHQKVTMKNEYIKGAEVLLHSYSADNSELVFVKAYEKWEDLEKSGDRDWELIKEAWPDSTERMKNWMESNSYYSNMHSDEIYSTLPNSKFNENWNDTTSVIFYMRKSHNVPPLSVEGGSGAEKRAVNKEFAENVIHKNKDVLAYYPMRHLYGADSREVVEFYVYESLAKMVADNSSNSADLVNAHWPDKEKRTAFFKKFNKYQTPWHGDWVYSNVPELHK